MKEPDFPNREWQYRPSFYDLSNPSDLLKLNMLRMDGHIDQEYDQIQSQLVDLYLCRFPADGELSGFGDFLHSVLKGIPIEEFGLWVYYPWRRSLVHILSEEEFIEVRTNRNQLKIRSEEQQLLRGKTIGIIGLSVGAAIAQTIAMERTCGRLKLADFDTLDLSNMNRLKSGVMDLGMPKVVLAAREIAQIDPYLEVEIFPLGMGKDNYTDFFGGGSPLDLLVEVCDGLQVKIESRMMARDLGVPVIMETNDRGMLDIERFDLEPGRPIFHGLLEGTDIGDPEKIDPAKRLEILMKIVDPRKISPRMQESLPMLGSRLKSWPQLASEVMLGAALCCWTARKLLLGEALASGRQYFDLHELLTGKPY
ncbi:ThiF family adenylyltransferase [Sphingobacterium sp. 1.A.4]|uniref:ThiF family adenylyltransferase n=1 Tax=Sphingobacterium sp. 1.A.4 TaxID=2044603 RepID=UPI000C0BCF75|nr:ThiF family adenylyltransferase [Sphingobacterium sp. 1.A.4]